MWAAKIFCATQIFKDLPCTRKYEKSSPTFSVWARHQKILTCLLGINLNRICCTQLSCNKAEKNPQFNASLTQRGKVFRTPIKKKSEIAKSSCNVMSYQQKRKYGTCFKNSIRNSELQSHLVKVKQLTQSWHTQTKEKVPRPQQAHGGCHV